MKKPLSRRQALKGALAAPVGSTILAQPASAANDTPSAAAQPPGQCVLLPQAMEGPFYFDPNLVRSDISEGRPGAALRLSLRIIEAGSCAPIPDARVDVWHADASGVYSGYAGQGASGSTEGQTYLRGTQTTDADGRVVFNSVYPGWYPGRTPHIHIKVFLSDTTLATGQIYFPDDFSARVYATREPYTDRPHADTTNASDWIYGDGEREGGGTVLAMSEDGDTIVAGLVIGVDRSGETAAKAGRGLMRRMLGL